MRFKIENLGCLKDIDIEILGGENVSSEFRFDEIEYKYILFDIKETAQKTVTSGRKINPEQLVDSDDEKRILVYQIHHLAQDKKELFNIRHLNLSETLP